MDSDGENKSDPRNIDPSSVKMASPVGDAFNTLVRGIARRGKDGAVRVGSRSRDRLEYRQLKKDLGTMYQKLGREVEALVNGGEVSHPGLLRGVARLKELEAQIAKMEGNGETELESE